MKKLNVMTLIVLLSFNVLTQIGFAQESSNNYGKSVNQLIENHIFSYEYSTNIDSTSGEIYDDSEIIETIEEIDEIAEAVEVAENLTENTVQSSYSEEIVEENLATKGNSDTDENETSSESLDEENACFIDDISDGGEDSSVEKSEFSDTEEIEELLEFGNNEASDDFDIKTSLDFDFNPGLNLQIPVVSLLSAANSNSDFAEFETKRNNTESCDSSENKPGCIDNPKVSTGSFEKEGDIEIRKLVQATENQGEYEISIAVRGKKVTESTENKVCAVVVFDKSGSMKDCQIKNTNGGCSKYHDFSRSHRTKWDSAVNGAISFSNSLVNNSSQSYVGLVTFSTTGGVSRSLSHSVLSSSNFGSPGGGTNLHAGLIEAKKMLDNSANCLDATQYIVVVSDGEPSYFINQSENISAYGCGNQDRSCTNLTNGGNSGGSVLCSTASSCTEGEKPSTVAINYANKLKESGIEIFAIGYETDTTANEILSSVASTDKDTDELKHFYAGNASSVSEVFKNIVTSVNEAMAGTNATVVDNLGATVEISNGESTYDIAEITEEGHVHTFTIKIDPSKSGAQETNKGLSLTYTDYNGEQKEISILESETASVNRDFPGCSGTIPNMDNIMAGSDQYPQKWENDKLVPDLTNNESAERKYVESPDELESCAWTCKSGYTLQSDSCVEIVYYTITRADEDGKILKSEQLPYGAIPTAPADPTKDSTPEYSFTFSGWDKEIETVAGDTTYTATYKSAKKQYEVKFYINDGVVAEGVQTDSIVDYAEVVEEIGVVRDGYRFKGWYDNADFVGEIFDFKSPITGNINLYAKREKIESQSSGSSGKGKTISEEISVHHSADDTAPEIQTFSEAEKDAYSYSYQKGITTIDDIDDARLDEYVTRAEMAKMISEFVMNELGKEPNREKDCSDFSNSILGYSRELQTYMVTACQLEIMGIHGDTYNAISDFMPNSYVTRAEFGTILSRILWGNKYEKYGRFYYKNHLKALKTNGIITNTKPNTTEYRSRIMQMLYRASQILNGESENINEG